METIPELEAKLKAQLIRQLNLTDLKPEDIDSQAPLFGDGLGLDSIDALEIIVLLEKQYGIKVTNAEGVMKIFYSIGTLAEYIFQNKKS